MADIEKMSEATITSETELRSMYSNLFHEMQFRCTKNALMNFEEAEVYQKKGDIFKWVTTAFTAASTAGVFAGVIQSGKMLANKFGLAGIVGLPLAGVVQWIESSSSNMIPTFFERAKNHAQAAASWMQTAERAKILHLKTKMDPNFDVEKAESQYEELVKRKEEISKQVLVSRDTHNQFTTNTEQVYLAIAKRKKAYIDFVNFEKSESASAEDINRKAEDIYF